MDSPTLGDLGSPGAAEPIGHSVPSVVEVDGATYDLVPLGPLGWSITLHGEVIGVLELVPALPGEAAPHWKVGDPARENLGVGATWANWDDAVEGLVSYRSRNT